jgi:probable sporulation protein (polysaccharide deacetylase family)
MRVCFVRKRTLFLAGIYLLACCLLFGLTIWLFPAATASSGKGLPTPYRSGDVDSQLISLAINVDWGEEYLPGLLAVLADNDVEATFFLTGRWTDLNPELAATIAAAGHELGNHGYSHASPNASSQAEIIDEISRTEQAIEAATGVITRLYAPPSGEQEEHVLAAASEAGYDTILWSVDTIDWQQPEAQTIVERVMNKVQGGSIILAHPTANTVQAFAVLLPQLQEKGYTFATVSANLGL